MNKLKAIWKIIWSDRYAVFTVSDPKGDSEYMQAGKSYNHISEHDPYFISCIENYIYWFKKIKY